MFVSSIYLRVVVFNGRPMVLKVNYNDDDDDFMGWKKHHSIFSMLLLIAGSLSSMCFL